MGCPAGGIAASLDRLPLLFVENRGQTDPRVAFTVRGRDKSLFFTPEGVTIALQGEERRWAVRLEFLGADQVIPEGEDLAPTVISYFRGPREKWRTGLRTLSRIIYRGLWPGIDLACDATRDRVKYEFSVAPGADPGRIRLAYRGADSAVDGEGRLAVNTPAGGFLDERPVSWQEEGGSRAEVETAYAIESSPIEDAGAFGFRLAPYDPGLPLLLDPVVVVQGGFLGGSAGDSCRDIAVDAAGNAYVTGLTESGEASFPESVGPDLTANGDRDVFVAKVLADGTALAYCGFLGGTGPEAGNGIAVDAAGNAYVTGITESSEGNLFPVVGGPDLTFNTCITDAFVAKVTADGTALAYCGYIGGNIADGGTAIAVDAGGSAYVTGWTNSTGPTPTFPVAVGPDLDYNGDGFENDAFVAKVLPGGTALAYCGYIGGDGLDQGISVAVDAAGSAYVTGSTDSTEATFPVAAGPDLAYNGGAEDAFVAKVSADGSALAYCGYLGGSGREQGRGVAVDLAGSAYVTGWTLSTQVTFPVAVGPDLTYNDDGTFEDAFVAKVSPDGTTLAYCGYIGGAGFDFGNSIAVDAAGSAYVTGDTTSDAGTFPLALGPDLTFNGVGDAFVTKVNTDGAGLDYCGYLGDSGGASGTAIAVDALGTAYVAGETGSSVPGFPGSVGPDLTSNGGADGYVAKIRFIAEGAPLVESFILPKKIVAKVVPDNESRSRLVSAGWIDLGPDPVDLTGPATVEVGDLSFAVDGFAPDGSGTRYLHEEEGLELRIATSKAGSSRAKFRLKAWGAPAAQVDPEGELTLGLESAVAEGIGTVTLEGGKFKLGKKRGSLKAPNLYLSKAKAVLKGDGKDGFVVTCGLATDGATPDEAPDLTVGFGDAFDASVAGEEFERKGDQYVFAGDAGGVAGVVLDYLRETIAVKAKGVYLGAFGEGAASVAIRIGLGTDSREVRVRMGRKGKKLVY